MIKFLRKKLEDTRASAGDSGEQLKPFLEHLEDLRVMVIRTAVAVAVGFAGTCYFTPQIVQFLQRPLEPIKAVLSPRITTDDILDTRSLSGKLEGRSAPLMILLRESVSPETFASLTNFVATGTDETPVKKALATDLNKLVHGDALHSEDRFRGVDLRPGTRLLLEQKKRSRDENRRLNRLLLEDALPREISRTWKPVHENLIRSGDNIAGGFNLMMTVSFWSGLLVASPFIVYFIVGFVAPALTERERKAVRQTSVLAIFAMAMGLALGWNFGLPAALNALIWFNDWMEVETWWTINKYISFTTLMLAGFAIVFEIPVVILILGKLGIVSSAWLRKYRRHSIVIALIVAAIATPSPDAASQMLIAGPLIVLYELCIWIIYFHEKKRANGSLVTHTGA